jgi:hypothetical protein
LHLQLWNSLQINNRKAVNEIAQLPGIGSALRLVLHLLKTAQRANWFF